MENLQLSMLEAFRIYAAAYNEAFSDFNNEPQKRDVIVERYQAVKHHRYDATTARLIGLCHGIVDA